MISVDDLDFDGLMSDPKLDDYELVRLRAIADITLQCADSLSAWEGEFLASIAKRLVEGQPMTDKQEDKLGELLKRLPEVAE